MRDLSSHSPDCFLFVEYIIGFESESLSFLTLRILAKPLQTDRKPNKRQVPEPPIGPGRKPDPHLRYPNRRFRSFHANARSNIAPAPFHTLPLEQRRIRTGTPRNGPGTLAVM